MRCDFCNAEMDKIGNMYVCDEDFTTYVMYENEIQKKYTVNQEFAEYYKKNKHIIVSNNSEKKFKVYTELLHICPNSPVLWNGLGVVYREKNMVKESLECYEKAINLNPHYLTPLTNCAVAYYSSGEIEKAYEHIETVYYNMKPDDSHYAMMLGNYAAIIGKKGRIKEAAEALNEAEARGYKNADILRKQFQIGKYSKENEDKGFFERLKANNRKAKEERAIKKAYQLEVEKRTAHTKTVRRERALTQQEQQTIDLLEAERDAMVWKLVRDGATFTEANLIHAKPYDRKIRDIRRRAVWYEEVTIPAEIDPSVPINIDEDAIRRSVR